MDAGAARGTGEVVGAMLGATEVNEVGNETVVWGLAI
jgi:hypothetical protein